MADGDGGEGVVMEQPHGMAKWDAQDWEDHYEERAAIIEHDGGRPRQAAELSAAVEVRKLKASIKGMRNRAQAGTDRDPRAS